jgi:hypothetical protein
MANENSTTHEDIAKLKQSIKGLYLRKKNTMNALCLQYAGYALQRFRQKQKQNAFWTNQTGSLFNNAFSGSDITSEFIGFYLSLTEDYGLYVELANNRKHEAVRPTVMAFYSRFMRDVEKIYAD